MEKLEFKLREVIEYHNFLLQEYFKTDRFDFREVFDLVKLWAQELLPLIVDSTEVIHSAKEDEENILFEGAQGTLLDIDHGTYPFVTSSNTTAGSSITGTGLGPLFLDEIIGIVKAYTTRVGSGPFPTELTCEIGELISKKGKEFGTTTGRARRCGWFDVIALRKAVKINSLSGICLTKLDVLDDLDEINVCIGYTNSEGKEVSFPSDGDALNEITPKYETVAGWNSCTEGIQSVEELPENARRYVLFLEHLLGVPITIISTGPDRVDTIVIDHPFNG